MSVISKDTTKLNKAFSVIDRLADIALLFLLCVFTSHDNNVKGENYLYYIAFFFFIGVMFVRALLRRSIDFSRFLIPVSTMWYSFFILLSLLSMFWATSQGAIMLMIPRLVQNLILGYFLVINICDKRDFRRFENIFIASTVYLTLRILIATPVNQWFSRFLGNDITGHNVNSTAFYLSITIIILFYRFFIEKNRYTFPVIALLCLMIVLTSSRKSLFMIIFGLFLTIMLDRNKSARFFKICLFIFGLLIFTYFMFTNENLYRAIGWKFDSMLSFLETGRSDMSLYERKFFRDFALELFYERPFFGVGLNNFSSRLGYVFTRQTYSHNNWLEMLSCLGVVGFITYYWFYAYCSVKLFKQVKKGISSSIPYLVLFVCLTISEYGMIVYYDTFIQLSIVLLFVGMSLNETQGYANRLRR